jgi:putative ABC transport system permease protein
MWLVSLRDLQWRRRRFAIAVGAISLVFAMSLVMSGVLSGMRREVRRIIDVIGADAWIVSDGASGPFMTSKVVPASAAEEVADLPGVQRADPLAVLRGTLGKESVRDVNLIGYRLGGIGAPPIDEGRAPRRAGEAVADSALHLDVGERVEVSGRQLEIVGSARDLSYFFGTPTVFAPIEDVQAIGFGGQPLAMAIATRGVPRSAPDGMRVVSAADAQRDLERPLARAAESIDFLNVLLFVVAMGIVGSMIYLSALERTRDFAVMKATGVSSTALLGGLVVQGVLLSVVAAGAAVGVALLLAPVFPMTVELTLRSFAKLVVVSLAIGIAASAVGFRRAARTDPALAFGGA